MTSGEFTAVLWRESIHLVRQDYFTILRGFLKRLEYDNEAL